MHRAIIPAVILITAMAPAAAQPLQQSLPAGWESGVGGAGSAYPFNATSDHIWQWHYDSAQFNHPGPIIITECYVRILNNLAANPFDFPSVELTMASATTDYTVAGSGGPPGPDYQVNSLAATFDIDQVTGTSSTPAIVNLTVGQNAQATFFSTNFGQPWEFILGTAPLIPASGGGLVTADSQVINIDLTDPTLIFLWNIFQSPGFVTAVVPFSIPNAANLSAQMLVVDPATLVGVSISQPTALTVQ